MISVPLRRAPRASGSCVARPALARAPAHRGDSMRHLSRAMLLPTPQCTTHNIVSPCVCPLADVICPSCVVPGLLTCQAAFRPCPLFTCPSGAQPASFLPRWGPPFFPPAVRVPTLRQWILAERRPSSLPFCHLGSPSPLSLFPSSLPTPHTFFPFFRPAIPLPRLNSATPVSLSWLPPCITMHAQLCASSGLPQ